MLKLALGCGDMSKPIQPASDLSEAMLRVVATAQIDEWNAAASKLPLPTAGAKEQRDGLSFVAIPFFDYRTREEGFIWEPVAPNGEGTGIVWP